MPTAPRRPRYFTGQLLTPDDLEAEQSYHLEARRQHDRHLHGWGIVSGLGVTASGSGGVMVEPGLAIDGLGRTIVVPEPREMPDPRQPIDDRGTPCGQPVDAETVTLCLAYAERPDDETDAERFVRETYVLEVHPGPAPESRAHCPPDQGVSIATVAWPDGELDVDLHPRRMLRSADDLLEIVHGLVRRVQALERRR